jgi:hypothetical protein
MKPSRLALLGASLIAFTALPSCVVNVPDENAHHTPYNTPARVTKLNNGNFIVNIDKKLVTFKADGSPLSTGSATPSEVYHAQEAVNDYIRGHRGEHMHPNYAYQSERPPEVRPRGDGKLEVLMPQGGVVLYDATGRMIQKGGTVTGAQLYDANKAVQSYIRENNSSRGYNDV